VLLQELAAKLRLKLAFTMLRHAAELARLRERLVLHAHSLASGVWLEHAAFAALRSNAAHKRTVRASSQALLHNRLLALRVRGAKGCSALSHQAHTCLLGHFL